MNSPIEEEALPRRRRARPEPIEPAYNYEEAAARLGGVVSVRTLRRGVDAGELPHHRLGKRVFFTESDILKILAMTRRDPLLPEQQRRRQSLARRRPYERRVS